MPGCFPTWQTGNKEIEMTIENRASIPSVPERRRDSLHDITTTDRQTIRCAERIDVLGRFEFFDPENHKTNPVLAGLLTYPIH